MSRELAILSQEPLDEEQWLATARRHLPPQCRLANYRGGIQQLLDEFDRECVSWWPSRRIEAFAALAAELGTATESWQWWTDVSIPVRNSALGLAVASETATAVNAIVIERGQA